MPIFTAKERRAHYNEVGYGNAPVKKDSKFTEAEQRAFARGAASVMNEQAMRHVLGKNSSLSEEEKQLIRTENKALRNATIEKERAGIKAQRAKRVAAKRRGK